MQTLFEISCTAIILWELTVDSRVSLCCYSTYPGYFVTCERLYVVGGAYGTIELKITKCIIIWISSATICLWICFRSTLPLLTGRWQADGCHAWGQKWWLHVPVSFLYANKLHKNMTGYFCLCITDEKIILSPDDYKKSRLF